MLPSEELSICFAPVAFRLHERFSTLGTGIISLVAEVRAKRAFSPATRAHWRRADRCEPVFETARGAFG
jgi:hypothetical protein